MRLAPAPAPALALALALALGGCLLLEDQKEVVEGKPKSLGPTAAALKVQVLKEEQSSTVRFDRVDWHVGGLEKAFVEKRYALVRITGTVGLNLEMTAETVELPDELMGYRWENMPEAARANRAAYEKAWDEFVAVHGGTEIPIPETGEPADATPTTEEPDPLDVLPPGVTP